MPLAAGAAAPVPAKVVTVQSGGGAGGKQASSVTVPPAPFTEDVKEPPVKATSLTRVAEGPTMELPPPPPARGLSPL